MKEGHPADAPSSCLLLLQKFVLCGLVLGTGSCFYTNGKFPCIGVYLVSLLIYVILCNEQNFFSVINVVNKIKISSMSRTFANRSSVSGEQHASGSNERGGVQQQRDNNSRRPTVADRTQRCD